MRHVIAGLVSLSFALSALPAVAQQADAQEATKAVKLLMEQESDLIKKKDAAGIAARFTSDGMLVMLAPKLAVKQGHEAIQKHYQDVIDAGVTDINARVQQVEMRGADMAWVAGTYTVTLKDKTIDGNYLQLLRREGGGWKIAVDTFARAGLEPPAASTGSTTPSGNK